MSHPPTKDEGPEKDQDVAFPYIGKEEAERRVAERFSSGGGDGNGGLEARLAKLEVSVEYMRDSLGKLSNVPVEVEKINGAISKIDLRVDHLPTKDYVSEAFQKAYTRIGLIVAIVTAIVGAAFKFIPS